MPELGGNLELLRSENALPRRASSWYDCPAKYTLTYADFLARTELFYDHDYNGERGGDRCH
jgi:hypothetical protein